MTVTKWSGINAANYFRNETKLFSIQAKSFLQRSYSLIAPRCSAFFPFMCPGESEVDILIYLRTHNRMWETLRPLGNPRPRANLPLDNAQGCDIIAPCCVPWYPLLACDGPPCPTTCGWPLTHCKGKQIINLIESERNHDRYYGENFYRYYGQHS